MGTLVNNYRLVKQCPCLSDAEWKTSFQCSPRALCQADYPREQDLINKVLSLFYLFLII